MRVMIGAMLFVLAAAGAHAHEVRAAIADFITENDTLKIEMSLGIEPLMAGVDLEGVEDTDGSGVASEVDALRALEPERLVERLREELPGILEPVEVTSDGEDVPLEVTEIRVPPVGNTALPRDTVLMIEGVLPTGARTLELTWPARYGTLVLRQMDVEEGYTGYLQGQSSGPIDLSGGNAKGALGTFFGYIPVGFDHILPKGLDHILFVLGLFFLSTRAGPLLWQISAFTAAHTVTLALGALGIVSIPASIVEPIIAASIVYVAVENLLSPRLHRWRPVVVFVFGLLHGLGFASVLQEFGLPQNAFVAGLLGFNVGVEFGQLTVIALAFMLVLLAQRVDAGYADVRTGQVVYAITALGFAGLGVVLDGPAFSRSMGVSAPTALWPLAGLCLLCVASATFVDRLHAYRRFVAMPASLFIALVGAWWFVERVFL